MDKKDVDKRHKSIYNCIYLESGVTLSGPIRWNALKNIRLKLTRGITFSEIIKADLIGLGDNPGRRNQKVLIFRYRGYIWVVPFVFEAERIFLKTIYPSRKHRKLYEKGKADEKER
jgi:hypothetical protein